MSTESLFYYRRIIPKEKTFEVSDTWDSFNPFRVVRGWWATPEIFCVSLDDGHEETREVSKVVDKNGKRAPITQKGWYVTQIEMCKEDADRLRKATELYSPDRFMIDQVVLPLE